MYRVYCKTRRIPRIPYDASGYANMHERAYVLRAQPSYISARAARACTFQSCLNMRMKSSIWIRIKANGTLITARFFVYLSGCLCAAMQRRTFTIDKYRYANDDR